jgi:hypothetical protein
MPFSAATSGSESKFDENIPVDAAIIFKDAGYQVSTVLTQGLGGKADPDAAAACKAESKTYCFCTYMMA